MNVLNLYCHSTEVGIFKLSFPFEWKFMHIHISIKTASGAKI